MSELFAYNQVTITEKGTKGFQISEIHPHNRNIFRVKEFLSIINDNENWIPDSHDNKSVQEAIRGLKTSNNANQK